MLLMDIVTLALVATGIAAVVRALPWPARLLARKPLSCVACMAFWANVPVCVLAQRLGIVALTPSEALVALFGAVGLASFLLAQTGLFAPPLDFGGGE